MTGGESGDDMGGGLRLAEAVETMEAQIFRHARERGHPGRATDLRPWIPAFAGMTIRISRIGGGLAAEDVGLVVVEREAEPVELSVLVRLELGEASGERAAALGHRDEAAGGENAR